LNNANMQHPHRARVANPEPRISHNGLLDVPQVATTDLFL
jgi:hypothetical protein